jgi:glutathione S-transferase
MILVGQYDSPFVRRVAIALRVLGFGYEHDTRSVFGDFDSMLTVNPLGRIPSLVLDDGEVLVDSVAMLDHLDQLVGPERALLPAGGPARRRAMQVAALAAGAIDKFGAVAYEQIIRPPQYRWPDWIARCTTQGVGGLAALEGLDWGAGQRLDQPRITTACLVNYVKLTNPGLMPAGSYPRLTALWRECETLPEFVATQVRDYSVPHG